MQYNNVYENIDGVDRLFIRSAEVIKKAKEHYSCEKIDKGIEWEN